ncbi:glycosyltransferase family 39 protein [Curtobacterium sp. 22159]|uniref:glycosyltransferase family 39 protein n=1 Tax=Curtobacterium sp. 22159 TaxID=3453882 RepID=UPI003F8788C9
MHRHGSTLTRASGRERLAITAIVLAFVAVLVVWASLQPVFGSPDEIAHWDAAVQLAMGHGWPDPAHLRLLSATRAAQAEGMSFLQTDRPTLEALLAAAPGNGSTNQMTQHPPTWYAMAAGLLHLIGYMHQRWDVDLFALRLMNVAILGTLPLVVWAAVRRLTRSPRTALVAAASLLLIPQVGFIGSSATNDTPVIILGAVVVWLVCRVLTGDRGIVTLVALALATSAAVAFKATALPLVPFAVIAVIVAGSGWSRWLRGAVVLVVPVVTTSWWWVRNVLVFHTLQPAGLPQSIQTKAFPPGEGPDVGGFVNTEWNRVTNSFWGQYGLLAFPSSPIVIATLSVVAIGVVLVWGFRRGSRRNAWLLAVLPLFTLAAGLQNNWSTYLRTTTIGGIQGRYYFVLIGALAVLSAIAWRRFVRVEQDRRRLGRTVVVVSALMTLYGWSVAYRGYYEEFHLKVTWNGLRTLTHLTPIGREGFALVAGGTLLLLVVAVALTLSALRTPPVVTVVGADPALDDAADPALDDAADPASDDAAFADRRPTHVVSAPPALDDRSGETTGGETVSGHGEPQPDPRTVL